MGAAVVFIVSLLFRRPIVEAGFIRILFLPILCHSVAVLLFTALLYVFGGTMSTPTLPATVWDQILLYGNFAAAILIYTIWMFGWVLIPLSLIHIVIVRKILKNSKLVPPAVQSSITREI